MVNFFFHGYSDDRDLHVLTNSFPTRRSSDLGAGEAGGAAGDDLGLDIGRQGDFTHMHAQDLLAADDVGIRHHDLAVEAAGRSEEHTSELQSLMRISYAVFCLKKKTLTYELLTPLPSTLSYFLVFCISN